MLKFCKMKFRLLQFLYIFIWISCLSNSVDSTRKKRTHDVPSDDESHVIPPHSEHPAHKRRPHRVMEPGALGEIHWRETDTSGTSQEQQGGNAGKRKQRLRFKQEHHEDSTSNTVEGPDPVARAIQQVMGVQGQGLVHTPNPVCVCDITLCTTMHVYLRYNIPMCFYDITLRCL